MGTRFIIIFTSLRYAYLTDRIKVIFSIDKQASKLNLITGLILIVVGVSLVFMG